MVIDTSLIVDYTTVLMYISVKLNYNVSTFENMGVVVAEPHPNYGVVVRRENV